MSIKHKYKQTINQQVSFSTLSSAQLQSILRLGQAQLAELAEEQLAPKAPHIVFEP